MKKINAIDIEAELAKFARHVATLKEDEVHALYYQMIDQLLGENCDESVKRLMRLKICKCLDANAGLASEFDELVKRSCKKHS